MENTLYFKGRAIGYEIDGRLTFFAGAPKEAIEAVKARMTIDYTGAEGGNHSNGGRP